MQYDGVGKLGEADLTQKIAQNNEKTLTGKDDFRQPLVDVLPINERQIRPLLTGLKSDTPVYDFKQIHFAVAIAHGGKVKRTTIMLDYYLAGALQLKHGLTDNTAIRAWIQQAIKDDCRFDSSAPLTRQVKRLIIESLV